MLALPTCAGVKRASHHKSARDVQTESLLLMRAESKAKWPLSLDKRKADTALVHSQASRMTKCRAESQMRGAIDMRKVQAGGLTVLPLMA